MFYQDKIVLITGGTKGVGRCIAENYAQQGAVVIIADIDKAPSLKLVALLQQKNPRSSFYQVDLSVASQVEHMMAVLLEQYGDIDIIINNAGLSRFTPLTQLDNQQLEYIMGINLRCQMTLAKALLRHRQKTGARDKYGRIVGISSTRHQNAGEGGKYPAKNALVLMTESLASSFSGYKVTVNCITPGWLCTEGYDLFGDAEISDDSIGRAQDIAAACLYLTDEANGFINGRNIVVDSALKKSRNQAMADYIRQMLDEN